MNPQTTRIAPSPTGDMHIGTARTAYFNYLAARASGGSFILRIDDTDVNRNSQDHIEVILNVMDWLGLDFDSIHYQSHRNAAYYAAAVRLIDKDLAYWDGPAIRLSDKANSFIPKDWTDTIAGSISVTPFDVDVIKNMVIWKSDGTPTYNFATAFDDMTMRITNIIRGVDHISNTPKQLTIMGCLNDGHSYTQPMFTHVGLICKDKKVLSKRDGASSMLHYRDAGYDPDAILNFMLRLGWAESDGKTIKKIDKDMAIDIFLTHGKMRSAPSNMDINLLDNFDRKYKAAKR